MSIYKELKISLSKLTVNSKILNELKHPTKYLIEF